MKALTLLTGLVLTTCMASAQISLNMVLESNWDDNTLSTSGGLAYNDCWGYYAANGTEVAILGTLQRVYFFDVTSPSNPVVIDSFVITNENGTTNSSIWRDFKTYDHYCYACSDQGNAGLLIFDLQYVPDSVVFVAQNRDFFVRSHNIWIDTDNARLYTAGANTNSGGTTILDLATDPEDPVEIGSPTLPLGYIHDIHVIDHIGYASHGSDQALNIYDFEDPEDPILIRTLEDYPEPGYNHSAWLNASGDKLVFADETHGKSLKLVNPNLTDHDATNYHLFKSNLLEGNTNSIAHNPFIVGDLCIVAYYHDGVQVFDISDTNDIEQIAYYDTYDNTDYSGYDGVWGVYPFLPSGIIIGSDTENGMFVLTLTEGVLPLSLVSFDAMVVEKNVMLTWDVTGIQEGEIFVTQYSRDGVTFSTLAEIPSARSEKHYSSIHQDPGPGKHYYRVMIRQSDGQLVPSAIRSVQLESDTRFYVRSTVLTDILTIDVNTGGALSVWSVDGKLLLTRDIAESGRLEVSMSGLPTGQYYVHFRSGDRESVEAVTKL